MNRWLTGAACALCGCVMLASPGQAADDKVEPAVPKAPWYKRYLGIGPEPPKPVPAQRRDPSAEAANERALAESHYERRRRVCDELLQVAIDTNNRELEEKAHALAQQAWDLYLKQTSHLPCSRLVPSNSDSPLASRSAPFMDKKATAKAADKLLPDAGPSTGRTSQANAFREVKP